VADGDPSLEQAAVDGDRVIDLRRVQHNVAHAGSLGTEDADERSA
jgi:hypothetical protein